MENKIRQKWLDTWKETSHEIQTHNQINMLLDGQNLVMFFTYNNAIYGLQEPSRVTFARMIKPDSEVSDQWRKEANFVGINLSSIIKSGKPSQHMFYFKDLNSIKIIDKSNASEHLTKELIQKVQSTNPMVMIQKMMQNK